MLHVMQILHATSVAAAVSKPSIIFILSDDLGYGDISVGQGNVNESAFRLPTPNIERLAASGVRFKRGYSGQVCAPSRCTLMTGRHLGHCTIRGNDGAYSPLLESDSTVASVLKGAGYRTALFGKWGLGNFSTSGYPLAVGFDTFVGQDTQVGCHNWYPETVCNNTIHASPIGNNRAALNFAQCLGPEPECVWANDMDGQLAAAYIKDSKGDATPFFMYLSTTTPHEGFLAGNGALPANYSAANPIPKRYLDKFTSTHAWSDDWSFAGAVWAMDVIVGQVVDALDFAEKTENTMVVFSGDNGPARNGAFNLFNDPGVFRGMKRSLHEGGVRQEIIMSWPAGPGKASTVSDELFTFWDFLATAADAAGVDPATLPPHDGISALPGLRRAAAGAAAPIRTTPLYWEYCKAGAVDGLLPQTYAGGWVQSIRWDDNATAHRTEWKAFATDANYDYRSGAVLLYNITDDQSESIVLAGGPAKVVPSDAATLRALAIIVAQMVGEHLPNKYWPSMQEGGVPGKCCGSCFSASGCAAPCVGNHPTPPPTPPPTPIALAELSGTWEGSNGRAYTLAVDAAAATLSIVNPSDPTSCWRGGNGTYAAESATVAVIASSARCVRHATGVVRRVTLRSVIDVDYTYAEEKLQIVWNVHETDEAWPVWTKGAGALPRPVE